MTDLLLSSALVPACLAAVAVLGCVQATVGAVMVGRFRDCTQAATMRSAADAMLPPISVLKPLHGDEPLLEEALLGFVTQDYPDLQIVFGVQSAADPAISVVQRLRRRFPDRDLCLVVDPTPHGQNRKVANLINMLPHATGDLLVIADSDIHAAPDYLRQIVRCFAADRSVGLVTTLYHGIPATPSLSRRLAAGQINHSFLPGVLLSRLLGRQDCLGSTMALHRDTLAAIGGLPMLSNHVADDSLLGKLVRKQGLSIAIAPTLTATTIAERRPSDLFAHELRWGRTVRSVEPVGYALSAVQYPLFWATLAVIAAPHASWTWILFAVVWAWRGLTAARIDRLIIAIGRDPANSGNAVGRGETMPFLLLPLRDWISAIIMASSFAGSRVAWRGQMLDVSGRSVLRQTGATPLAPRPILAHARHTLAHQTFVRQTFVRQTFVRQTFVQGD